MPQLLDVELELSTKPHRSAKDHRNCGRSARE
jgi:hypothetical protein